MSRSNKDRSIDPPKWPLKVLRFFLKKEYLEEIEGDMEEIFRDNIEQLSYRKARRIYVSEMLRLLRPILIKNLSGIHRINQVDMFKNYFMVSVRGGFAQWTYRTDQFHEHNQHYSQHHQAVCVPGNDCADGWRTCELLPY
jgi:hypothetical protein